MAITTHWKVVVSDSYVGAQDRGYAHFWEPSLKIAEQGRRSEMLYQLARLDWRDAGNGHLEIGDRYADVFDAVLGHRVLIHWV